MSEPKLIMFNNIHYILRRECGGLNCRKIKYFFLFLDLESNIRKNSSFLEQLFLELALKKALWRISKNVQHLTIFHQISKNFMCKHYNILDGASQVMGLCFSPDFILLGKSGYITKF